MKRMVDDPNNEDIRIIEHTADWALRLRGRDLKELFAHAAEGMAYLLAGDVASLHLEHARDVVLESHDAEELLVLWLGEMAYWAERDGLVFPEVILYEITPVKLVGTVRGGRPPELQKHIKAVTYHDLAIRRIGEGLEVTVVFDV
ncbi:MAG: archease [Anaerolineae bacterium]|nr:archease [Anaerolineae bacterium]